MTPDEKTDQDNEKIVADFLKRLTAFTTRETEDCPYCGTHISRLQKVGRCVYCSPCGCRLWQGSIPDAWRIDPPDATRYGEGG